jgi:hypothetical protein
VKKLISAKLAGNILLSVMGLLIILHVLILMKIVPSELVWGGRIKDESALILSEILALAVTLLFATTIAIKIAMIKVIKFKRVVNFGTCNLDPLSRTLKKRVDSHH